MKTTNFVFLAWTFPEQLKMKVREVEGGGINVIPAPPPPFFTSASLNSPNFVLRRVVFAFPFIRVSFNHTQ